MKLCCPSTPQVSGEKNKANEGPGRFEITLKNEHYIGLSKLFIVDLITCLANRRRHSGNIQTDNATLIM
jgi:hypothetical protein